MSKQATERRGDGRRKWLAVPALMSVMLMVAACGSGSNTASKSSGSSSKSSTSSSSSSSGSSSSSSSSGSSSGSSGSGSISSGSTASSSNISNTAKLTVAVGVNPDTLDPVQQTTTTISNMVDYVAQTLVKIDKTGKLLPNLATKWSTASNGLSVTFQLRPNVKFQDGTAFNAAAVKYNIDRLLNKKVRSPQRGPFQDIKSVTTSGNYTVTFNLSKPDPSLVSAFSLTNSAIMSPASFTKHGNSFTNVVWPVGTGPYEMSAWNKGSNLILKRFAGYWGTKPYYEQVVFQVVPEAATRESLVRAGQAQVALLPPASDLAALEHNPSVKVLLAPSDRTIFIAIHTTDPKLKNPLVRQALNYAVNKKALIKNVLFGAGTAETAPIAKSVAGYCKTGYYAYNPAKAKALLKQAGESHITLNFISPTGRYLQDFQASQAIAGYLRAVGINTHVRTMDWPTYVATITKPPAQNTTELHFLGWAPGYLDASQQMLQFEGNQAPPNGLETSFFNNAQVNKLLAEAATQVNPTKRAAEYCSAEKIIWKQAPWIFLWTQHFPILYSSSITGVSYLPNEKFNIIDAHPVGK